MNLAISQFLQKGLPAYIELSYHRGQHRDQSQQRTLLSKTRRNFLHLYNKLIVKIFHLEKMMSGPVIIKEELIYEHMEMEEGK